MDTFNSEFFDGLCPLCHDILSGQRPRHDWTNSGLAGAPPFSYDHYATGLDLCNAASARCVLCCVLKGLYPGEDGTCLLRTVGRDASSAKIPIQLSIVDMRGSPVLENAAQNELCLQVSFPRNSDAWSSVASVSWRDRFRVGRLGLFPVTGK